MGRISQNSLTSKYAGVLREFWKETVRGTKFLFLGEAWNFFNP